MIKLNKRILFLDSKSDETNEELKSVLQVVIRMYNSLLEGDIEEFEMFGIRMQCVLVSKMIMKFIAPQ